MAAKNRSLPRSFWSDFAKVAAHVIEPQECEELPELTADMLARGKGNKGDRPVSLNPKKLISLRLPEDIVARWRATGSGWQTRMAEKLARVAPK